MFEDVKKYLVEDYKNSDLNGAVFGGVGLFLICAGLLFSILYIENNFPDQPEIPEEYLSLIPIEASQQPAVLGETNIHQEDYDTWLYSDLDRIVEEVSFEDEEIEAVYRNPQYEFAGSDREYQEVKALSSGNELKLLCPSFEGSYLDLLWDSCEIYLGGEKLDDVRRNLGENGASIHMTLYDNEVLDAPVLVVGEYVVGNADGLSVWKLSEKPERQYFFDNHSVSDSWFGLYDTAMHVDDSGNPYLVTMYHNPSMTETMLYRSWDMDMEDNNLLLRETVLLK